MKFQSRLISIFKLSDWVLFFKAIIYECMEKRKTVTSMRRKQDFFLLKIKFFLYL